jgi:ADP-heptose:LPS heptosyltransferase
MNNELRADDLINISKILVIRLGPFGDVLLTTSYFESLKNHFPDAELHYLMKEPYHKVVLHHPCIDRLVTIPKSKGIAYYTQRVKTIKQIRKEKYDLVIDHQGKPSSQIFTWLSGAPIRLGFSDTRFHQAYNVKASRGPVRYSASAKFDILKPINIPEQPYTIYFHISQSAQEYIDNWLREQNISPEQVILVSPGSPIPGKKWSAEHYARLCDLIVQKFGFRIVLLWGPGEKEDCIYIQNIMKSYAVLAPPTNLEQAAAFLRRCRLLLCNDGGLNHLAVSTGTTTLAFFGNEDPLFWSPATVFEHHHHLHVPGDRRHGNSFGISPETAFTKIEQILSNKVKKDFIKND